MEKWNLYNDKGEITDKIHLRGELVPAGYYHMVIHIWLRDESGRFLIQQRAQSLDSHPGIWAATGGSAILDESSIEAVKRETLEELGLELGTDELRLLKRLWRRTHFLDLWLAEISSGFEQKFRPTEEVDAVAFRELSDILQMVEEGTFFRYRDDYFEAIVRLASSR